MKGQLALDYIFKIVILLVTVAVIIGLIFTFSNDIQNSVHQFLCNFFTCPNENACPDRKSIEKDTFASSEISAYIQSCDNCYSNIPEADQKDAVCYLLIAKKQPYFNANAGTILNTLPLDLKTRTQITTNFASQIVKIEFKELGNKIVVSSP
jgi:hypothetical protein